MASHLYPDNKPMRKLLSTLLALTFATVLPAQTLQLQKGDHIAFVGGGLADRQQHHGHFEALIHQAHPEHQLVIRNLGFSGDELGVPAHRSDEVPPLEYFLDMKPGQLTTKAGKTDVTYHAGAHFHANVIFAYWGFNESFKGAEGLDAFRSNLAAWLKKHGEADYGQGKPRIVLFSPIANEDVKSRFFDPKVTARNNVNLALYVKAMAEVAKSAGVQFVDLFTPSQQLFAKSSVRLTVNGIHVNAEGDRALAPLQFVGTFGRKASEVDEKVRAAVNDKSTEWHHRYRTVDQFNIYGQRSRIKYEGVDNATVIGRELQNRDIKTANRDKAVWAAAQGKVYVVSDDNLLGDVPVPPNRKEPVPYLPGAETLQHLGSPEGTKVEFIADEKTVPDLINPVQMNFDNKGRLWIACWPNYPETNPKTKVFDKLLVLDLDPATGKVVKSSVFLDGLNCPTGFQFYKDGVILIQSPDIWFVRDTDGDGKADWKERLLTGMDAADSHHETNSICYEPGGAIYLSDGVFHRSQVETAEGVMRNVNGAIYRFEPQTGKLYRHAPYGFANPHGRVFDYWGNDLITDATGNANYFGPGFTGHLDSGAHPGYFQFWNRPSRPCPGTTILSSRHFPDDWQGDFLNANVITYQGVFRAKLEEDGAGIKGTTLEPGFLYAKDIKTHPNFRPSGMAVAPDGSVYVMDWSQMLIGHLQHHLRDPNRDHQHGRLYRVTYPSRPLLKPKKIDGEPIEALLELLKEHEDNVRQRAKVELHKHDSYKVIAAVQKWVKQFDPAKPEDAHHILEALWVHQWHDAVNLDLIRTLLKSPAHQARAQALRVVCYQRDRIPGALAFAAAAAEDPHPRVRLEAARTLSFFKGADVKPALEAAMKLKDDKDRFINYCLRQTVKQLTSLPEGKGLVDPKALVPPKEVSYGPSDRKLSQADKKLYELGKDVYFREAHCVTCHQPDGKGADVPGKPGVGAYPSLVKSNWLEGDPDRVIKIVLNGLYGPMQHDGRTFGDMAAGQPVMTGLGQLLKDEEVAAVITYVRQSWGNNLPPVKAADVKRVRQATKSKTDMYVAEEVLKAHPLPAPAAKGKKK